MTPQPPRPKISYKSADPAFTSFEASRLLEETDNKDLHFTFTYWELASVGSTAREILRLGKANYKFECPSDQDWTDNKVATCFSYLPMMKITAPDGKELVMSESMVIDVFLAERFGLLGENKWESLTIQSFYSNIHFLRERTFSEVADVPKDRRKETRDIFLKYTLKKFLQDHEFHLLENGNNGHYVGDKLSLADIHLSNIVHFYETMPWGHMVIDAFKDFGAVWKVKETVDKVPEIAAWRATKEFNVYEKGSLVWYKRLVVPGEEPKEE
ncbi:Glutathione S-transferase S1 [Mortierella sp. AM989]|nr:Glutathione S-transferase S1 [Mortierella sp. AM989]